MSVVSSRLFVFPFRPAFTTGNGLLTVRVMREPPKMDRPRIGLALSGGAARGIAHIGVLRALEENAIPIDAIA